MLFVRADRFLKRDKLMRNGVPFVPDPHRQRTAMNIFDDVDLALMFRKRQPARAIGQSPLPRIIVDRKTDEFDQRGPGPSFRFVFVIWSGRRPYSREVDLGE